MCYVSIVVGVIVGCVAGAFVMHERLEMRNKLKDWYE